MENAKKDIFKEHVLDTYAGIAHHFHVTRNAPWPEMKWYSSLLPPNSTIADVGCGNGRNTIHLASLGHTVHGLDIVPEMVSIARRSTAEKGLEAVFEEGDIRCLPWETESMDGVVCVAALHHLPLETDRRRAMEECWRVLGEGGKMLVSVWAREQPRYSSFEIMDDPGDVLVSWKRKVDGAVLKRYYHLYTRNGFEEMARESVGSGVVFSHADNHQLLAVKDGETPSVPCEFGGDNAVFLGGRRC